MPMTKGGLEDVIAATSTICDIIGPLGKLTYRGIDIHDLARNSSFEETTYLLWFGSLPTREALRHRAARCASEDLRLRPPRVPHRRPAGHSLARDVARARRTHRQPSLVRDFPQARGGGDAAETPLCQRRLLLGVLLFHHGDSDRHVHAGLRRQPGRGLGGARARAVRRQPPDPAAGRVRGGEGRRLRPDRPAGQGRQLGEAKTARTNSVILVAPEGGNPTTGGRSNSSYC